MPDVETFGRRNAIESWFSGLKRRIKQFNTCFPTYRPKVAERWIKAWVALTVPSTYFKAYIPWCGSVYAGGWFGSPASD
ncbi:MAG: hypothetical protein QXF95_08530 [Candidatus Caldarchaeum sp.]